MRIITKDNKEYLEETKTTNIDREELLRELQAVEHELEEATKELSESTARHKIISDKLKLFKSVSSDDPGPDPMSKTN